MPTTLPPEFEVVEGATARIAGILTEEDGVTPLPGSTLSTLVLTVYDADIDKTVIVDHRNILNAGNSTVDEDGALVVLLPTADMPIRNAALPYERHTCLFEWSWGTSPVRHGKAECVLVVRNLAKVP